MPRPAGQVCSVCEKKTTLAATKSDGDGGRRCKVDCTKSTPSAEDVALAPSRVAPKPAPVNRRGKPAPTVASETARTCRVCNCTAEKPCDDGAGRPCVWTSSETPASGDLCSVCADAMALASELLDVPGAVPAEVAKRVEEDAAPCVDAARVAKILERAIAARTPTKKDRPRREKKSQACPDRNGDGHCPTHGATCPAVPAQAPLPGLGAARVLTLPTPPPVVQLPDDRGSCPACGTRLTPENSSRLPWGPVVHVGCAAAAPGAPPIELSSACSGCDAERGEPCAWATAEPASYVHAARVRLLAAEQQREITRRATEDRIRALCDYYASLPHDPPLPTEAVIVRALAGDGAFTAMRERGELLGHNGTAVASAETYYRRAPGSPVVMGRVGVRAIAPAAAELPAALAELEAEGALSPLAPAEEAEIIAAAPGQIGPGQTPIGLTDAPLSPAENVLAELFGATSALARVGEAARACLAAEVAGRAAVEQLDAVQRERDQARQDAIDFDCDRVTLREQIAEARAEVAKLRVVIDGGDDATRERDEALVRRDAAETAIRELADALGVQLGASPAETCVAVARRHTEDVTRWSNAAKVDGAARALLRKGMARAIDVLVRAKDPPPAEGRDDAELSAALEAECWRVLERDQPGLRGERDTMAARVLTLRAGIVAALAEPPAAPADLDDAALAALLRSREEVPGGEPPESLDGVVAIAVHQLTGEAPPIGQGIAPLASALGEAVRGVLAERAKAAPIVPTPALPAARPTRTFQ